MTTDAVRAGTPRISRVSSETLAILTVIAGCVALASRPVSDAFIAITIAVGVAGAMHPLARGAREGSGVWCGAVALGIAAFAIARGALGGSLIPPPTGWLMTGAIVAAVAEEAFFRRLAYGALLRWGVPVAIAVSSLLFGFVHITVWGWRAFPVDVAAGALLGWQRSVTGSWTAPALTHMVANILMLL